MNDRWLKYDIIGPYSGILYGKQGDMVKIISQPNEVMILVEFGEERFHVRAEALSDKSLADNNKPAPVNSPPKSIQWMEKKNPVKTENKSESQASLF